MTVMIDPCHIWNVIYNARSNRSHNPTSPNTAPATQNESHDWSASHMKRHLQCAEQQESQSNFTKYCACHAKWISWLIRMTDETSFTMRGATGVIPQLHQILRLPRKMNLMIAWSASHMKRHLHCAEQAKSPSNLTKHCACHAKWISWLIRVTYETSFTITEQQTSHHNFTKYCACHAKWISWLIRVTYGHLECAEQAQSASNLTKHCACHEICKFKISAETPWIASANRKRFEDNPSMIRAWNRHLAPAASETLLVRPWTRFCMEKYNISRSGYLPKCHQMLRLPRKVTLQLHQKLRLPRKMHLNFDPRHIWNVIYNARSKQSQPLTSPNTAPATKSVSSRLQRKVSELLPPI